MKENAKICKYILHSQSENKTTHINLPENTTKHNTK